MMTRARLRSVVFDLGEVLSVSPAHFADLARLAGAADVDAFTAAYWARRAPYDAGGESVAYWADVLASVGRDVRAGGDGRAEYLAQQLAERDAEAWAVLHELSLPLLRDVRDTGTRLALLSNAPAPLARAVRAQPWAELFDALVFSCELGLTKPDPAVFAAAAERMGAAGDQLLFFDDREANVRGAAAAGWQAHLWAGHDAARAVLRESGVLA
jgi:putative hydrolase of the HAD superfamily